MKHKRKGIKMSWVRYGRGIAFGLVKGPNASSGRFLSRFFILWTDILAYPLSSLAGFRTRS